MLSSLSGGVPAQSRLGLAQGIAPFQKCLLHGEIRMSLNSWWHSFYMM